MLADALAFVRALAARGGKIIFVGTKRQASLVIRREAERVGMPFVDTRWLGGTITNFEVIARVIEKYLTLKSQDAKGELGKYTKKEQVEIHRDITRMEGMVGGIQTLKSVPDALFVVDVKHERTAVREALAKKIPIVAVSDTNTNPTGIAYPIPANDDALKSIEMITKLVADAVLEGKAAAKEAAAAASAAHAPEVVAAEKGAASVNP
jgi:small subunit ribosomal protein S2